MFPHFFKSQPPEAGGDITGNGVSSSKEGKEIPANSFLYFCEDFPFSCISAVDKIEFRQTKWSASTAILALTCQVSTTQFFSNESSLS